MSWIKRMLGLSEKMQPMSINDSNFQEDVIRFRGACLLDVWGPNCQPCAQLAPVMQEIAAAYNGTVRVCEMNAAGAPRSTARLGIRGTPTVVVYRGGAEIGRIVGFKPFSFWQQLIEKEFAQQLAEANKEPTEGPEVKGGPQPPDRPFKPTTKAAKKALKKARQAPDPPRSGRTPPTDGADRNGM
ncbi:MAG: hypothetical protein FJ109_11215 [Deltaproteobacteria bacterium]|nr:hypothetical protein [Deltaproteobacteria bacterium]